MKKESSIQLIKNAVEDELKSIENAKCFGDYSFGRVCGLLAALTFLDEQKASEMYREKMRLLIESLS